MNISSVDLNLLVIFDALMTERSVSRAAQRVGLSQPATSNALARLRALFDDPLLVRQGNRMAPTDRALSLIEPVRSGLGHLSIALTTQERFDPATARRVFTIAASDYICFVMLSRLIEQVRRDAPGIVLRVTTMPGPPPIEERIDRGDVDLALGPHRDFPDGIAQQKLFDDHYMCLVREDHPGVGKRLSVSRFALLDHLLVAPYGGLRGVVDAVLAERGLERHIALYVPSFMLVPPILAQTDLICTITARVGYALAPVHGLRVMRPPVRLHHLSTWMQWNSRHEHSPAHRWLRQTLVAAAAGLDDVPPSP